ncbi:MAG: dephospho-CoA kinase [Clostridia bacterium]|nr:dephospho-CoA kinase [Clostridia bacterium]
MIIFITGKSGSGKSTFSKLLANQLNYKYIDVDAIGHKIYEFPEVMEKAYRLFGTNINDNLGKFDRKKLGQIVFSERHSERVKAFSDLTWEYMKKLIDEEMVDNCVVDWILLPHTKYWKYSALKILILPQDENLRLKKLMTRDNITEEYVKLRDKASIEYNQNEFDFVFINDYNEQKFKANIEKVVSYVNSATLL